MTVGFAHLTKIVPTTSESVFDLSAMLGEPPENAELLRANGLSHVPVAEQTTTADLVRLAIGKLLEEAPRSSARIGLAMIVHSLPAPAPADVDWAAQCLDAHGLSDVPVVQVSGQPCAIMHQALALARDWLALADGEAVLIVGADAPNRPEERLFFGSAMGDAAVAGLMVANASRHRVLACHSETRIEAWEGEYSPADAIARFRAANPALIRAAAERCIARAGLTFDDIALICPHTPNRLIWNVMSELLRVPRNRIFDDEIGRTGHLNSNDSLVHYLQAIESERLRPGDLALLINPGFGGTRGCTLMRY